MHATSEKLECLDPAKSQAEPIPVGDRVVICPAEVLAKKISQYQEIWQYQFLTARDLARFCKDRGFSVDEKQIDRCWQRGLLRADYVVSRARLRRTGFVPIKGPAGLYWDLRKPRTRSDWLGSLGRDVLDLKKAEPYFHPYRWYVLYEILRIARFSIIPLQPFQSPAGYLNLANWLINHLRGWSRKYLADAVESWSAVADACALFEPLVLPKIRGKTSYVAYRGKAGYEKLISRYRKDLVKLVGGLSLRDIDRVRRALVYDSGLGGCQTRLAGAR